MKNKLITILTTTLILIPAFSYAETEKETIARVIAAEACGEGEKGMELVAQVINNRSKDWNKTPFRVVTAKNQFYGITASNSHKLYAQCHSTANRLAESILTGQLGHDLTNGALYFRQPKEAVYSWHKTETLRFKNHIFYK